MPKTRFPTASGKLQLFVKDFADKGFDPLPFWTPKRELPSAEYPLYLVTTLPASHRRNSTQTMDDILARRDVGGSACIMDAVVSVEAI